ncbi:MAG: hypothetical protein RLO17_04935 [Cyclobacteriaceae bacterium]
MGNIIAALEKVTEGDEDFKKELSEAFIFNFEEFSETITRAVENRNFTEYRAIVHKIKPSFLTIEMEDVFQKVSDFSTNLDQKSEEEIEEFKSWVKEISDETIEILRSV